MTGARREGLHRPDRIPAARQQQLRAGLHHAVRVDRRRPAFHGQLERELAPAVVDAERRDVRRRSRRPESVPRLPAQRVSGERRNGASRQRVHAAGQSTQLLREGLEHRVVAGRVVGEPEDVGRRGIHERRERPGVRPGPHARPRCVDARCDGHVRVATARPADRGEDAGLLRAGAGAACAIDCS